MAANIAKIVANDAYTQISDGAWVYELTREEGRLRVMLVRFLGKYGNFLYVTLYQHQEGEVM